MRKDLHTLSVSCLLAFAIAGCDSADTTNRDVFESIAREPKVTIASARQLVTNGELQKAQKQCQALLLEDPENFEAARLLTSIYVREGRVDDAVETLKALSEKHPDQANKLNATVAELLFESGRSDAAISELRSLIERDPESLTYRRQLASMLNERGFRFDANEQLRFLAARQPLSIRELIGLVNPLLTWVSFADKPDWTNKDVIERHGVLNVVSALRAAGDTREALQCLEQSSLLKLRHPAAVAIHG
ncbi:MAG: tetratricopeptide repeat protein, partial [Planctomycetota bacterium]